MAQTKPKNDNRVISKASSKEDYDVQYLMIKYDLNPQRARELIAKHGGNREKIEAELEIALGD